jgi:TusA-related sulfurtransferase
VTDDHQDGRPEVPAYDVLLDERGSRCPVPVIALAREVKADPDRRLLLLSDDPAAQTDIPAWCSLRGRTLAWTGPAPDGGPGDAFLVVPA